MNIETILNLITSPGLQKELWLVKVVFLVFTAFFGGAFLYYFFKTEWLRELILRDAGEFFSKRAVVPGRLARQWEKIKRRLETGTELESKLAIMEADDFIEDILRDMGCEGDNLEEKLSKLDPGILHNPEKLLEVHKVRDNIAHEPDFSLTKRQSEDALEVYERALRDIEAL